MTKEEIKTLFVSFPEVRELYEDENGSIWISKQTAKNQSKNTGVVKTHKRTDFITNKKIVQNGNS